jgi:hypothetical protein
MGSIGPACGEWPYLSFRDPLGYVGVKTDHPIKQIRKRWANADRTTVPFLISAGKPI